MPSGAPLLAALLCAATPAESQPRLRDYSVVFEQTDANGLDDKLTNVSCPEGTSILGGGAQTGLSPQALRFAHPGGDYYWTSGAFETAATAQSWQLSVTATCGNVADYEIVQEASAYDSSSPKAITAQCPQGTEVLGGGASSSFSWRTALTSSAPDGNGWYARAWEVEATSSSWDLRVTAICGNVAGRVVVSELSSADSDDSKYVTAQCPPGTVVLSGGTFVGLNASEVLSTSSYLDETSWGSLAFEPIPHDDAWTLRTDVICAPEPRRAPLGLVALAGLAARAVRRR